ncbi:GDSL esterase/lipase At5g03980-like isoform X1 [Curcuma longa]|uniref:GDSL esterase/lipase At5g03980-like isoform X1 n=1 Tax=Curcuma longa TaxID=136217 RepID=UPI003D9DBCC5
MSMILLLFAAPGQGTKNCFIDSIYSFGDSIADTGNLLQQGPVGLFAPIGRYPYGKTMNKSTGRCSDGLLMIDYFALNLNLSLIDPYLLDGADFRSGVNFAVAGSTALDSSVLLQRSIIAPVTNKPLSVQLQWFKTHLNSTCSSSPTECSKKLEHALILMGEIGGNDYNNAFFQGSSIDSVKSFVPRVVDRIVDAAKEVIDAGAVQLVIPGNFPIGCMPSYLTMFYNSDPSAYDDNKCLKDYNSFAMYHNKQLQAAIEQLRQSYPKITFMYADYYQAFMYLLNHTAELGFDKDSVHKACCGAGGDYNFDFNLMCGLPGTTTCSEPTKYISWDGIHLTQEAYKTMAQALIMQGFAFPNHNIHDQWKC